MEALAEPAAPADPSSPCVCGSRLRRDRCCELDWSASWPQPAEAPEIERAGAALAAGRDDEAGGLLVGFLNLYPLNLPGLGLLHALRLKQDAAAAVEALLTRIVRLEPNNLAATQALALQLFGRGAMAEAEHHARNTVRMAPNDPQSHNLMGMIMTEAQRPQVGEHHYRRVIELVGKTDAVLLANLAWNLK